jgi:hypothetical protein
MHGRLIQTDALQKIKRFGVFQKIYPIDFPRGCVCMGGANSALVFCFK